MGFPTRLEMTAALRGFAAVLRGEADALRHYDLSVDGFWRSFWPALLLTVPYVLLLEPLVAAAGEDAGGVGYIAGQGLLQLANWFVYLGLMIVLCRAFGLTGRYAAFVVLYNWAQAIAILATLPVLALTQWGLLPPGTPLGWSGILLLVWLYAVVRMARIALGAPLPAALMAALLDLAVTVLLHRLVDFIL